MDAMDGSRILSGYQLVSKGVTTKDGSLPEHGLKGVSPSGTWLEQKQIQSALEARKHLIEVERIEKRGNLSHAIWRDDLKLAEVTQKVGGHWQFIGHNVGKHLYLRPEEALFLIELNCLLLKHNEITVSLQKAYSLCLNEVSIVQYKVYASLSRLGYRVLRHQKPKSHEGSAFKNVSEENRVISEDIVMEYPKLINDSSNKEEHPLNCVATKEKHIINGNDYVIGSVSNAVVSENGQTSNGITNEDEESISNKVSNDMPEIRKENHSVVQSDNVSETLLSLINPDKVKVETVNISMEIIENNNSNAIEKPLLSSEIEPGNKSKGTSDEMPSIDEDTNMSICNKKDVEAESNQTAEGDQETNVPTFENKVVNNSENDNNINLSATTTMDIDDNGTNVTTVESNANNITNNRVALTNIDVNIKVTKTIADNRNGTPKRKDTENSVIYSVDELGVVRVFGKIPPLQSDPGDFVESTAANNNTEDSEVKDPESGANDLVKQYDKVVKRYVFKIKKLIERKSKTGERSNLEGLNRIPDLYEQQIVKVNDPDEEYLPRNIFLHKAGYVLNINTVRNQNASNANVSGDERDHIESPPQTSQDAAASNLTALPPQFVQNTNFIASPPRYPQYQPFYRPSPHWRPRHNQNMFYGYNRYRMPPQNYFVPPRFRFQPRPFVRQHLMNYNNSPPSASSTQHDATKRTAMLKEFHFNAILNLATRFKTSIATPSQVRALNSLLNTFNSHYDGHFELTRDFDIVNRSEKQNEVQEVIILDNTGEPQPKKSRLNDNEETINDNLEKLKALAAKLKDLHMKNLAVSRHRRVFSNAIKTFNKSFKADLYLDSNFEIKDRKLIVLDSSSDSDVVVSVKEKTKSTKRRKSFSSDSDVVVSVKEKNKSRKRRKLRNPFNILKRVSKHVEAASTSREVPILQSLALNVINDNASAAEHITCENDTSTVSTKAEIGEGLLRYFDKGWLPSDDDFGRAELCSRVNARLIDVSEADYLSEVVKKSAENFENWLDLKIAVLKDIQASLDLQKQQAEALSNDFLMETECQIQPILSQDCTDLRSALKQLAIIKTSKEIPTETSLRIDFDVCNRDKHFKKTSPPKPNFRVICLDESEAFPSSADVACLQSKYEDGVPIVFAFVGNGASSITYLQINATDLPVYIPDNDMG